MSIVRARRVNDDEFAATRVGDSVEFGLRREVVEVLDVPSAGTHGRVGRIRHANGENVAVDYETWIQLRRRAAQAAGRWCSALGESVLIA